MPVSFNLNSRRRIRCTSIGYNNNHQSKSTKRKCASVVKSIKLLSAILVPIMIGVFTVITTLQESKRDQFQHNNDLEKIGRQAQLQREMDALKMKEQQEYEENNLREIRVQSVYDVFMREISSVVLKDHFDLTIPEFIFARAKTLAALEQIDPKRKWYLVKFLYDSQLLYANKTGKKYIDLAGADLSNVRFDADKEFISQLNLENIRLSRIQLSNSSFENIVLDQANFQYSALNNSNCHGVSIAGANFKNTILEYSKLILFDLQRTSFENSRLKFSSWSLTSTSHKLPWGRVDYSNCDLTEASFEGIKFDGSVKFDQANFQGIKFSNVQFATPTIFRNLNMTMSKFINVVLVNGQFIHCNMSGAIIEKGRIVNTRFDHVDLRQSQFNYIFDAGNLQFINTNLIGSNLNVTSEKISLIIDSFLPNKTFKTSFTKFGMNLIENSDAEQGQCYYINQSLISIAPHNWLRQNNVIQMYYNNSNWKMNMINYTHDLGACFFFGGSLDSKDSSNSYTNSIQQEINLQQLFVLIESQQAKYIASAYIGGFDDELSATSMRIEFKNMQNKTILDIPVGTVTNVDRRNKTTMLFRSINGPIPKGTVSMNIQLRFQRQRGYNGVKLGMADNLELIIQQK